MLGFLKPAPFKPQIRDEEVDELYKKMRWKIFLGIFFGYAAYYLVRKNYALAIPNMITEYGYSATQLGFGLTVISLTYGVSKFLMGIVSDRSNPQTFFSFGLLISASAILILGVVPAALSSIWMIWFLLFIGSWGQGMGWPPCGRTMVHWWSKNERGKIVSIWNCAHNVGGGIPALLAILGMYLWGDWRSALYFPAVVAMVMVVFIYVMVRDTPQSCGLPSIEIYRNDIPDGYDETHEKELAVRDILVTYVLKNRLLWYIAIANAFVYLIRYGVLDWSPHYLKTVKGLDIKSFGTAYFLFEWAGIPGTLFCGWVSDKVFKGRRGATGVFFMVLVTIAVFVYWMNINGPAMIDVICLIAIGFLIYGPVMLIGLHAIEIVPKKAAGTAAGFTGLFGYFFGSAIAGVVIGYLVTNYSWDASFELLIFSGIASVVLLLLATYGEHKQHQQFMQSKQ